MFEKINFEADDPIFLTGLTAGTVVATILDDWVLVATVAAISMAAISMIDNDDIVKFAYGFAVSLILTSLAKLMRNSFVPNGIRFIQQGQQQTRNQEQQMLKPFF